MPIDSISLVVMLGIVNISKGMCAYGNDDICSLCICYSLAARAI